MSDDTSLIAQIGRTIGLWGDLKFHLHTDFPEQFKIGNTYQSNRGNLSIVDINFTRGTIKFAGYESIDAAKKLTNVKLYANKAQTKENCELKNGQYFWFDILNCVLMQDDSTIGVIVDIQRMADTDYLYIATDDSLVKLNYAKHFLLPYIDRYIVQVDIGNKLVHAIDAKDILEAS
ncbi:MAG: 16S rRNA processing protein RimM [Epsilonproteobacteria bacterium]|nr:MAG: 16S rRNA processing protein RimM [Campylobacterota bacterium]